VTVAVSVVFEASAPPSSDDVANLKATVVDYFADNLGLDASAIQNFAVTFEETEETAGLRARRRRQLLSGYVWRCTFDVVADPTTTTVATAGDDSAAVVTPDAFAEAVSTGLSSDSFAAAVTGAVDVVESVSEVSAVHQTRTTSAPASAPSAAPVVASEISPQPTASVEHTENDSSDKSAATFIAILGAVGGLLFFVVLGEWLNNHMVCGNMKIVLFLFLTCYHLRSLQF
jgi:hypothetical protein